MKFLILHPGSDPLATTVASLLDTRHPGEVAAPTLWDLQNAKRWSHEQACGKTHNQLILPNGTIIDPSRAVVFNRLPGVTVTHFANSTPEDKQYATEETHALVLSWLAAFKCPVVNPATHAGLAGPYHDQLTWYMLAHRAGLPTPEVSLSSSLRRFPRPHLVPVGGHILGQQVAMLTEPSTDETLSLYIVGDQVVGNHPITLREPIKALAKLANADFLEIQLTRLAGANPRWVFTGANPVPFHVSDEAILALVYLLESKLGAQS